VFDDGVATLFDPLDDRSFAYLLPLSATEALLESASFGPNGMGEDRERLLGYLESGTPGWASRSGTLSTAPYRSVSRQRARAARVTSC
jgi:hypothetical protein